MRHVQRGCFGCQLRGQVEEALRRERRADASDGVLGQTKMRHESPGRTPHVEDLESRCSVLSDGQIPILAVGARCSHPRANEKSGRLSGASMAWNEGGS